MARHLHHPLIPEPDAGRADAAPTPPSGRGGGWEPTLTRRVRSLVRTAPLHRVEAGKAQRALDLERHDLRALSLRAIDATIEHMGLGYGARRKDIADALEPLIRAADPAATSPIVDQIADLVVEHLLNEANRRLQFDEPYAAFEAGTATRRTVRFHLLKEEEADDGSIVLKATTEAINLYAGMLDVDVEDAQTAAEAVLQAQIARGAIGAAVATARQARLRSIEYAESLRSTLRQVRRDVARVETAALLRTVGAARRHLEERLHVERGLVDAVEERLRAADLDEEAGSLVELADALGDCRRRHLKLHEELLGLHDTWLHEQERQRFRRARASALPDLEKDVFVPIVAATVGELAPILDALLRVLHAPVPPPVFDLAGVVEGLLAPRRRQAEADHEHEPDALEPTAAREVRFDEATVKRVAEWLGGGGTLGELLASSRAAGDDPAVRRLLVLRVLESWDGEGDAALHPQHPRRAGRLRDLEYEGDDLALGDE